MLPFLRSLGTNILFTALEHWQLLYGERMASFLVEKTQPAFFLAFSGVSTASARCVLVVMHFALPNLDKIQSICGKGFVFDVSILDFLKVAAEVQVSSFLFTMIKPTAQWRQGGVIMHKANKWSTSWLVFSALVLVLLVDPWLYGSVSFASCKPCLNKMYICFLVDFWKISKIKNFLNFCKWNFK